jgi:bifunctional ADP-heptose synthase (sugar kinase/adenylyltransferase)
MQVYDIGIVPSPVVGHTTMVKERFVEEGTLRYLFRVDDHKCYSEMDKSEFRMNFDYYAHPRYDAVVVSDYDLGTVGPGLIASLRQLDALKLVYTRKTNVSEYSGFNVLKVNLQEAAAVRLQPFEQHFGYVVVTKGADGAELRQYEGPPYLARPTMESVVRAEYKIHTEQFPVERVPVRDVVGAGDAYLAGLAFSLIQDRKDPRKAVRFANQCATSVIQKFGGAVAKA